MKLRGMYKTLLIAGAIAISLSGCGNKEKPEVTPMPTEAPTEVPGLTATPTGIEEGITSTPIEEDILQTPLEEIGGEGMVDEEVPDISDIQEAIVGEPVMFFDAGGADLCLFAIESIAGSDMKIENMGDATGKKAVVVNYSFENISSGEGILIDDMSFKLLVNNEVATPYFSPELTPAELAAKGETSEGQIAFLVDSDVKDVVLVFENVNTDAKALFKTDI